MVNGPAPESAWTSPAFCTSETSVEKSGLPAASWRIEFVGAGAFVRDGGTRTRLMTWMTPFEAATFGATTVVAAVQLDLAARQREGDLLALERRHLGCAFAAAIAAAAVTFLPTTW